MMDRNNRVSITWAAVFRSPGRTLAAVLVCTGLALGLAPAGASALVSPLEDPFYTPPANLAQLPDGAIIRSREVTMSGPQQAGTAAAYQLVFRTTSATGQPTAAVTTVLVPTVAALGTRVLATYEPAYDSMTLNCAPSYTLQGGNPTGGGTGDLEEGFIANELAEGWDVNIPDYEGLQSEWAVGPMLGHASLDSVRAAEHFAADGLTAGAQTEVTFTGYSGGSIAADWSAALAPSYAPELNIIGIAAGGNLPDYEYTESHLDGSLWYGIQLGTMESFSRAYSQINLEQLLNPAGLAIATADGSNSAGCSSSTLNEPDGNATEYTNFPSSEALAAYPPVKQVLDWMSLRYAPYPATPEYIYNSVNDDIAFIAPVDALVTQYCAAGVTVDYDRDALGGDHVSAIPSWWSGSLAYLIGRYAGEPAPDNCATWNSSPATP
jgi:Secretory lipase